MHHTGGGQKTEPRKPKEGICPVKLSLQQVNLDRLSAALEAYHWYQIDSLILAELRLLVLKMPGRLVQFSHPTTEPSCKFNILMVFGMHNYHEIA